MATLWQIVTDNSKLAIQAGTTFWDHLNNQESGTTIYEDLTVELSDCDYAIEITEEEYGVELDNTELTVELDDPELEIELDNDELTVEIC